MCHMIFDNHYDCHGLFEYDTMIRNVHKQRLVDTISYHIRIEKKVPIILCVQNIFFFFHIG